jgi:hypothetical protein
MSERALAGYEKASQSKTIPALKAVRNLGLLYRDQGKLALWPMLVTLQASKDGSRGKESSALNLKGAHECPWSSGR